MTGGDAIAARAAELGVESSYWDVQGSLHEVGEVTLQAIVDVLEADEGPARQMEPVVVTGAVDQTSVAVGTLTDVWLVLADGTVMEAPVRRGVVVLPADLPVGCHRLEATAGGAAETATLVVAPRRMPRDGRLAGRAGLFVPAYALWEAAAPLPSFTHLAALAARAREMGIDVISTLPLYAGFLDDPFDPSPYAPISRLHWNEVYLDDDALPSAPAVPLDELIDWPVLARRRRHQLLDAAADLDPDVQSSLDRFGAERPDVDHYARFRVGLADPTDAGRPAALIHRSHLLAQFLAHHQLAAVEAPGRAVLALDLPIGSHRDGFEGWAHGELFAPGMSVGAPPDEFFVEGQDWGFPPQLPGAGRRSGHSLWRQLVARAGEHCSILRIDHVMGVHRLWWVPEGMSAREGAYVRYPREELLAVIAAEATRTATTVVGEDLGTVAPEVLTALARWDVLGMYEEQFHLFDDHLDPVPARALAGLRTHDMPPFATVVAADVSGGVDKYRQMIATAVGHPVGPTAGDVLDAVLERLAGSAAFLVVADLDDLVGETAPHNVPGRVLATTWRRRLRRPASDTLADEDVRRRVRLLSDRPPWPGSGPGPGSGSR